jgi:hypothetical protein
MKRNYGLGPIGCRPMKRREVQKIQASRGFVVFAACSSCGVQVKSTYLPPNAKQVAFMHRWPAQEREMTTPRLAFVFWITWSLFSWQPTGLDPYFTGL